MCEGCSVPQNSAGVPPATRGGQAIHLSPLSTGSPRSSSVLDRHSGTLPFGTTRGKHFPRIDLRPTRVLLVLRIDLRPEPCVPAPCPPPLQLLVATFSRLDGVKLNVIQMYVYFSATQAGLLHSLWATTTSDVPAAVSNISSQMLDPVLDCRIVGQPLLFVDHGQPLVRSFCVCLSIIVHRPCPASNAAILADLAPRLHPDFVYLEFVTDEQVTPHQPVKGGRLRVERHRVLAWMCSTARFKTWPFSYMAACRFSSCRPLIDVYILPVPFLKLEPPKTWGAEKRSRARWPQLSPQNRADRSVKLSAEGGSRSLDSRIRFLVPEMVGKTSQLDIENVRKEGAYVADVRHTAFWERLWLIDARLQKDRVGSK